MHINDEQFMVNGGTERGVLSTTRLPQVAADYASGASRSKTFFRIKVNSPMDMGADVGWLSAYPGEAEVIYPPLSYLKPLFKQDLKDRQGRDSGAHAYTMTVSFPS